MDTYKLRSVLRDITLTDTDDDHEQITKDLRDEIENKLYELERKASLVMNYREVLRDILR